MIASEIDPFQSTRLPERVADKSADAYFAKLVEMDQARDSETRATLYAEALKLLSKWRKDHKRGKWEVRKVGDPTRRLRSYRRGMGAGCSPLQYEERMKICGMYRRGVKCELIGLAFGCSTKLVYKVLREEGVKFRNTANKKGGRDART